jgi:Helix-turn-helix domain
MTENVNQANISVAVPPGADEYGVNRIEPLYSEEEAARRLGIKARSLRTERTAGRIGFKRVAGKIMYRHDDLTAWQREGERCQAVDRTSGQNSSSSKRKAGSGPSTTSGGAKVGGAESVRRALEIGERLKKSSGSLPRRSTAPPGPHTRQGRLNTRSTPPRLAV